MDIFFAGVFIIFIAFIVGAVVYIFFWDSLRDFFNPISTPEMDDVRAALAENADRINEIVAAWEQEHDARTRKIIIEPIMKTLFVFRQSLQIHLDALKTREKFQRDLSDLA